MARVMSKPYAMILEQINVENLPLSLAVLDANHILLWANQQWTDQFPSSHSKRNLPLQSLIKPVPDQLLMDIEKCIVLGSDCLGQGKAMMSDMNPQHYVWKISPFEKNEEQRTTKVLLQLDILTDKSLDHDLIMKSLNIARIGGWELDLENKELYWSKITKEIHEVPQDFVPKLEEGIYFYKEGHSRETITQLVNDGISKGIPWDTELQIVTAKGKELWVRAIGDTEMVNGTCKRVFGTFQDIDKQKRAELDSQSASDRLRLATTSAHIGIWEYNLATGDMEWGDMMYQIYGLQPKDFHPTQETWNSLIHPADRNRTVALFNNCLQQGSNFDSTYRIIHPSGEIRWIKAVGTFVRNPEGNIIKIIGTNNDITELTNIQGQLHKSESSLRGAFQNSSVGMALVALDGSFIDVNPSLCDSLGYSKEELTNMSFQDITHGEDLEKDLGKLSELMEGKRTTYQLEKRYFTKSGQQINVLLTVTGVHKVDGSISHFISQIVDITSRKKAEKKLKRVLQLTMDQNNSLMNFAHIVSHNLRSHAANLSMITSFLIEGDVTEEEQADSLNMLHSATDGLNETIAHLNEVVQVQTQSKGQLKKIELFPIIQKVLGDISALIQENNVDFMVNVSKGLKISAVPAYVESIVLNLATNAIKYRNPKRQGKVTISAVPTENKVILKVEDNGLGIDMNRYGDKIFGMYKTFHNHKDSKGIGLFITKNQVESMGGRITVHSQTDEGTTFTVEFLRA